MTGDARDAFAELNKAIQQVIAVYREAAVSLTEALDTMHADLSAYAGRKLVAYRYTSPDGDVVILDPHGTIERVYHTEQVDAHGKYWDVGRRLLKSESAAADLARAGFRPPRGTDGRCIDCREPAMNEHKPTCVYYGWRQAQTPPDTGG